MKTTLPFIMLICLNTCWSQNYRPIPETNATWIQAEFLYSVGHEFTTATSVVYTLNDTLINGQTYCKFGSHGIVDWVDNWNSQQNYNAGTYNVGYAEGCFRQDTIQKKVFLWNGQSDELLYDFGNLVIGQPYPETRTNSLYPDLLVMAKDSVQLLDGNYYTRWVLGTDSMDSAYVSVIEGVGSTSGFNTPIYPQFEHSAHLLCHKTAAGQIYENWSVGAGPFQPRYSEECSKTLAVHLPDETQFEIFPNPATSAIAIRSDQPVKAVEVYNLNGQSFLYYENTTNGKELNLDLTTLEQGMYLLKIVLANGYSTVQEIQVIK